MNATGTSYQTCERIVSQEMFRIKDRRIGVLDEDDLRQELVIAAMRGAERADDRPGNGYVRTCVRNAIVQLYAHVSAAKRHPQDRFGRPVWFANPDIIEMSPDEATPGPEAIAIARERVEWLISSLPPAEAALVKRAARGEIELTRREANHIRYTKTGGRMSDEYDIPERKPAACHVRGDEPEGYNSEDSTECHSCIEKFTCLPEAVADPGVWTSRGAKVWEVDDDHEVAALIAHEMTFKEAEDRVRRRANLTDAGELIPPELLVRKVADVVDPEPEIETPVEPDPTAEEQEATVATKKKVTKKATKKKAPKRPAKKKAPKKVLARPRKPAGTTTASKALPGPATITEEKMVAMLGRVKLGKRIDFTWGMEIVRKKKRGGGEDVVTITKNGFLYEGQSYSSLSAAAQNASGTFCRSGNDWFNMRHPGTEVRSAKGKVIASRTVGS